MEPEVKAALRRTVDALIGYYGVTALKTVAYYLRVMRQAIRDLYASGEVGAFIDKLIYLVDEQFRRAWYEGARDVGVEPENMTDDDRLQYMLRAEAEKEHILGLAEAIIKARDNSGSLDPLLARAEMWSARYNEVRDAARAYFGDMQRLVWTVGPTEHCGDCIILNGTVAMARDWAVARERGIYPKSPELECHGFRCQCSLTPTDAPLTAGGIPI